MLTSKITASNIFIVPQTGTTVEQVEVRIMDDSGANAWPDDSPLATATLVDGTDMSAYFAGTLDVYIYSGGSGGVGHYTWIAQDRCWESNAGGFIGATNDWIQLLGIPCETRKAYLLLCPDAITIYESDDLLYWQTVGGQDNAFAQKVYAAEPLNVLAYMGGWQVHYNVPANHPSGPVLFKFFWTSTVGETTVIMSESASVQVVSMATLATAETQTSIANGLSAVQASVNAIENLGARSGPRASAFFARPATGYSLEVVELRTWDGKGRACDPVENAVTVTATAADSGNLSDHFHNSAGNPATAMDRIGTGVYRLYYRVASTDATGVVLIAFAWAVREYDDSMPPVMTDYAMSDSAMPQVQDAESLATMAAIRERTDRLPDAPVAAADVAGLATGANLTAAQGAIITALPSAPDLSSLATATALANVGDLVIDVKTLVAAHGGSAGSVRDFFTITDEATGLGVPGVGVWISTDLQGLSYLAGDVSTSDDGTAFFELNPTDPDDPQDLRYVHARQAGRDFPGYPRAFTVTESGFAWA